jgi:hypothetical protein
MITSVFYIVMTISCKIVNLDFWVLQHDVKSDVFCFISGLKRFDCFNYIKNVHFPKKNMLTLFSHGVSKFRALCSQTQKNRCNPKAPYGF